MLALASAERTLLCPLSVPLAKISATVPFFGFDPTSLASYLPGRELLIVGTGKGSINAWKAADGSKVSPIFENEYAVQRISPQPGGKLLAIVTKGTDWALVDASTGKELPRPGVMIAHMDDVLTRMVAASSVVFSPDGKLVLVDYGQYADAVFEVTEGQPRLLNSRSNAMAYLNGLGPVGVTFSHDGKYLARSSSGALTRLFEARSGVCVGHLPVRIAGGDKYVPYQAFSPEGDLYLVVKRGDSLFGEQNHVAEHTGVEVWEMDWSKARDRKPEPSNVLGRLRQTFLVTWKVPGKKLEFGYPVPRLLPKGRIAIPKPDGTIEIADARTADRLTVLKPFEQAGSKVILLALSPDGKTLASGSDKGEICAWNVDTFKDGHCRLDGREEPIQYVDFTPDGKYLIAAVVDKDNRANYLIINRETLRAQTVNPSN